MDTCSWVLLFLPLALLGSALWLFANAKKENHLLPPSPPGIPVLGNLFWLRKPLLEFSPAIRRLSVDLRAPAITLNAGPSPAIFVVDRDLAHQALVQKGAAFADRPAVRGATAVFSSDGHNITSARGAVWRALRRNLTSEILHLSRVRSFAEGRRWVLGLLVIDLAEKARAGDGVVVLTESSRVAMFRLLVFMCFGEILENEVVDRILEVQRDLLGITMDLNIFDLMPNVAKILFWRRWRRFLAIRRRQEEILFPLIAAQRNAKQKQGKQRSIVSYLNSLLDLELPEGGGRKLTDGEIVSLCSEFFNGGTDTTSTTLEWAMANLVKHQHVQQRLLDEINGVVERSAEITEDDLQKMPYLKAVVLETLRRHPPVQFVLPHAMAEDAELGEYAIPKGTRINFTVAEMGWDGAVWEEPMEFRPERFVTGEGVGVDVTGSREIRMMPFGAGRRICPGLGLAMLHLEYLLANLVREFEWKEVEGEEVDLSETIVFTVVMKNPLRARILPRTRADR